MTEQFITMSDGHKIFTRIFEKQQALGHIHIIHGMAEHSERYLDFANMLQTLGYTVSIHDSRGHGRTVDENGLVGHLADENGAHRIVEDVYEVLKTLRTHDNLILFGHSMGSFVARRYTQLYSETIEGAIYCATGAANPKYAVGIRLAKGLALTQGGRSESTLMNRLNNEMFNLRNKKRKTDFDWLSTDEDEVQKFIDDPKCGFCPTNQFYVDLLSLIILVSKNEEHAKIRSQLPVLFLAGDEDPVGDYTKGVFSAAKTMQKSGLQNVLVYLFERMRHEILNEKNKQHVYDVIKWWLANNEQKN